MLTPYKNVKSAKEKEFNRVHSWYRARSEHYFAELHTWEVVNAFYRGVDMDFLEKAITVLCSMVNVRRVLSLQYPPYSPCAESEWTGILLHHVAGM